MILAQAASLGLSAALTRLLANLMLGAVTSISINSFIVFIKKTANLALSSWSIFLTDISCRKMLAVTCPAFLNTKGFLQFYLIF